jgi:hypothetical protein
MSKVTSETFKALAEVCEIYKLKQKHVDTIMKILKTCQSEELDHQRDLFLAKSKFTLKHVPRDPAEQTAIYAFCYQAELFNKQRCN